MKIKCCVYDYFIFMYWDEKKYIIIYSYVYNENNDMYLCVLPLLLVLSIILGFDWKKKIIRCSTWREEKKINSVIL